MTDLQKRIIGEFNALPDPQAQHEVLDLIYDALYHQSYLQVIGNRVIREKDAEAAELRARVQDLEFRLTDLRSELGEARAAAGKAAAKPAAIWGALSKEEREAVKAEMVESVFYRNYREQLEAQRRRIAFLKKTLAETQEALGRAMRGADAKPHSADAPAPQTPAPQKPLPSLLERLFGK